MRAVIAISVEFRVPLFRQNGEKMNARMAAARPEDQALGRQDGVELSVASSTRAPFGQ
jgi:hypothetical protein